MRHGLLATAAFVTCVVQLAGTSAWGQTGEQDVPSAASTPRPVSGAVQTVDTEGCVVLNCDPCCVPRDRSWAQGEFLLWWLRKGSLPPLVTVSPPGTGPGVAGVLGQPTTALAFGESEFGASPFPGGRLTLGRWLDDNQSLGVEASGFFLARQKESFAIGSDDAGSPILARPRLSAFTGLEQVQLVSFPGAFAGSVQVAASTEFWGAGLALVKQPSTSWGSLLQFSLGVRYLELNENLDITQTTRVLGGGLAVFQNVPVLAPNTLRLTDRFNTENQFFGGQVGVRGKLERERFTVSWGAYLSLGSTHQVVNRSGSTELITAAGVTGVAPGGLLVLPSNAGRQSRDDFTVVPELDLKVGYDLTSKLTVFGGYNLIYSSSVVRPGSQIDRTVNITQQPSSAAFSIPPAGPARPAPVLNESDFWAQGLNFGVMLKF